MAEAGDLPDASMCVAEKENKSCAAVKLARRGSSGRKASERPLSLLAAGLHAATCQHINTAKTLSSLISLLYYFIIITEMIAWIPARDDVPESCT